MGSVLWETRDGQARGWLSHGFILLVLEGEQLTASVPQDWPFAAVPVGSGAGDYWLIQGPVLQHCLPGVGHSTLLPPGSSILAVQQHQGKAQRVFCIKYR